MKNLHSILKAAGLFLILLIFFIQFFHPITAITEDLGRHLLSGKLTLEHHEVTRTNYFSYTNPSFPLINVYWLSEVVFYLIYLLSGFNGLLIITTILAILSWFILSIPFIKKQSILPFLLASALFFGIFLERTEVRPEIFSYFFLSIFSTILFIYKKKYSRFIFLLIPCIFLWINLHIYFILGIGLLGIYCLDLLFSERKNLFLWIKHPLQIPFFAKILFAITFVSVAVSLINPYGIKLLLYPFVVTKNFGYTPLELQNTFLLEPFLSNPAVLFFKISFISLFILLLLFIKRTSLSDWLISIIFTILGIQAIRNLNLYVFAVFPIFTCYLYLLYEKIFENINKKYIFSFLGKLFLVISGIILLFYIAFFSISTRGIGFGLVPGAKNAVDFFEKEHIQGPIFNNFTIGSYLIYRLFPKEKVFVDNRPEAYPAWFFEGIYIPMRQNEKFFNDVANTYHINSIIITYTDESPIVEQLTQNKEWVMVYLDDYATIFVKNSLNNDRLIKNFSITENSFNKNTLNNKRIDQLEQYATFFQRAKWNNLVVFTYKKIYSLDHTNCTALAYLLQAFPQNMLYTQSYQHACQ